MLRPARAEHIGSLKRPEALLRKRADFEAGKCAVADLRALEDESIAAVVKLQLQLRFPIVTDGEFRRYVDSSDRFGFGSQYRVRNLWQYSRLAIRNLFYEGVFDKLGGMKEVKQREPINQRKRLQCNGTGFLCGLLVTHSCGEAISGTI